ncbi:MAG: ATP-binding protein [Lachnospiraceae bacterium]|nr:ATP-binding protein [Lachnospiraceae bacterium]
MKPEGFWTFVQEDWQIYMICLLVYAVVLIIIAYMYGNRVARPLQELVSNIGKITDGYLGETFSMNSYMEIEEVVDSINHMMAKLEQLESSRQEFVSNVSHELKTPITSVKVLADSLLQQEDAPAELYREFLADINEEIERENKIITDLLSLVKMDKTAGELNISSVNINELCEQIIKRMKPIANKRNISLIFEAYRPIMADVDEVKLSLAINNLIENAVKYNYDEGWVRVSLNTDHKFFYIKVSDSGVGIPADEQENVFERFYRVDKARSRETGGTGLGLAITRNAILMHRGAIKIYSKEKEGTTFTVRIPITYANT